MSKRTIVLALGAILALLVGTGVALAASLTGSNFEIDTNANLKVDGTAPPALDWANVNESRKADKPTGATDDSFGNGTKEDTAVPAVVDGSIPPNKSDLLNFGVYLETTPSGARFLNLFWHRVQEPTGTTNMDFEFNQSKNISANGVTPIRKAGDLLIQYDLANGGTNPQLFLSKWVTAASAAADPDIPDTAADACQASSSFPCWSTKTNLTSAGDATGSINTTAIPASENGGITTGPISARTFGEAQIDFDALTGGANQCSSFGSAYLKSRSSDSFTSALKDFIAPQNLDLNNCATVIIRKETTPDEDPNTTNFGFTKTFDTDPSSANSFTLQDDGVKSYTSTVKQGTGYVVDEATIPNGWDLTNINCDVAAHPSSGVTPQISVANGTVTFDIDSASDVLDCTYRNRAKGTIIVEKITNDGSGAFDFTSSTLTPSPFTLTTTSAGAGGKDSKTFADLTPGTYDVAETVPTGWNLVSSTCDDQSPVSAISLQAGETVTCTFRDAREKGAIVITKLRKHAADGSGDQPHPGVTFKVTGGELPAAGVTSPQTNANGKTCVDGLVLSSHTGIGDYTVHENTPAGYNGEADKTVTVDTEASCDLANGNNSTDGEKVTFHNTPLTDITVSVDSKVDGGTGSTIDCDAADDPPFDKTVPATSPDNGDGSFTLSNKEPGTYTCTIVVDP